MFSGNLGFHGRQILLALLEGFLWYQALHQQFVLAEIEPIQQNKEGFFLFKIESV